MCSRLVALTLLGTVVLGGCAHEGPAGPQQSIFEHLFQRPESGPAHGSVMAPSPEHLPAHSEPDHAAGEPIAVPVRLVGPKSVASTDGRYLLDTGDRLRIFVYGQPNLSRLYIVDHDGKVTVPLIGAVHARGQTTYALEGTIRARLGSQFVKDPQVTVDVQQNRPFFILGEVRSAGQFPYVSGMTIETAVAIAGGYSERANESKARITRRIDGLVEIMDVPPDYIVQPGDTVYVYERFF